MALQALMRELTGQVNTDLLCVCVRERERGEGGGGGAGWGWMGLGGCWVGEVRVRGEDIVAGF